jgi:hypothetical protein
VYEGVTVTDEVIAAFVVFVVVNDPMFPVEPAPKPDAVLLFTQVYTVPATFNGLVNVTEVDVPTHNV